jgi:hypothetical protein
VEGRHSTWACRTFSSFWKQRLSVTLARRLACVILLRAQGDYRTSYVVVVGASFIVCLYYCLSCLVCDVYFYCGNKYFGSYD